MKSRFNTFIEFPDYTTDEMEKMLRSLCKNNDYDISDDTYTLIREYFDECISREDTNFANGRLVRNLYDDLVMNHARRVANIEKPTKDDLTMIIDADFDLK